MTCMSIDWSCHEMTGVTYETGNAHCSGAPDSTLQCYIPADTSSDFFDLRPYLAIFLQSGNT